MAVGFLATTVITAGVGYVLNSRLANEQVIRTERLTQANAFITSTQAFPAVMTAYNEEVLAARPTKATRKRLEENLTIQHEQLRTAKPYLSDRGQGLVEEYQAGLLEIFENLDGVENAGDSVAYSQAVARTLAVQDELVAELRASAGIESRSAPRPVTVKGASSERAA